MMEIIDNEQKRRWDTMLVKEKMEIILTYFSMPEDFIEKKWGGMTEAQKTGVCGHQKLSDEFVSKYWNEMTDKQRNCVCMGGSRSVDFVVAHWDEMTQWQQEKLFEKTDLAHRFVERVKEKNELTKETKNDSFQPPTGMGR